MSYPKILHCNCVKNDRWIVAVAFVLTILPCLVHTVKWSNHPWPSSCFTLCHQPLGVFLVGCSQVLQSKNIDHCFSEPLNGLQDCVFTNADVVINCIGRTPICQDSNNCNALHQRACTYLSTCISSKLEPIIILLNGFCNGRKKLVCIWKRRRKYFSG